MGLVEDDHLLGCRTEDSLLNVLDRGAASLAMLGEETRRDPLERVRLSDVTLHAPLAPRSIRDFVGFRQHLLNCSLYTGSTVDIEKHSRYPIFYFTNPAAVIGSGSPVVRPKRSVQLDFELEVAAVIGTAGADIAREDALGHVAGYMIFCDWSARDVQMDEMKLGLGPAKGKDFANSLGPFLVTPDELAPWASERGFDLRMTASVNGKQLSEGLWSSVDWGFEDMIAFSSQGTRLRVGDVLGSGTVPTGCLLEHLGLNPESFPGWLDPGDEVVLEIEQLGRLCHVVAR
ncbi:MAG: fumarylacetoacetate hydrolase family protein [Pseudonocardiaceae bacterium]|nr:MAG: fumarylacetoacetate hydrolase family protein [Pseudonocardiaceae bacterium]